MLNNDINELKQLRKEKQKTKKSLTDQIAKILYENKEADVSQLKEQRQQVRKEIKQLTQKINNPNYKYPTSKIRIRPNVCVEMFGKRHKYLTVEEKREYLKIAKQRSREKSTPEQLEKDNLYRKEYYLNNKEKIAKKQHDYNEANKEKIKERNKRYMDSHKADILAYHKKYYGENKEKYKIYAYNYQKENRERLNTYKREYNKKRKEKSNVQKEI